jgi:hypothetical protein
VSAIHRAAGSAYESAVEQQKMAFSPNHLMMKNSGATNPMIPDNVRLCRGLNFEAGGERGGS